MLVFTNYYSLPYFSDTSLLLAKHLSPAYVRITGPSTRLVKEVDVDDKRKNSLLDDESSAVVTPSMWFDINEWLKLANLTPVFGVNDTKPAGEVWNPESTLLEIFDRLNVSCYWMLGFGKNYLTISWFGRCSASLQFTSTFIFKIAFHFHQNDQLFFEKDRTNC